MRKKNLIRPQVLRAFILSRRIWRLWCDLHGCAQRCYRPIERIEDHPRPCRSDVSNTQNLDLDRMRASGQAGIGLDYPPLRLRRIEIDRPFVHAVNQDLRFTIVRSQPCDPIDTGAVEGQARHRAFCAGIAIGSPTGTRVREARPSAVLERACILLSASSLSERPSRSPD